MSISSSTRKAGPYSCNGATVAFPFSFKVFAAADVRVVLTDADDVESDLVLGTNYTVALNADQDANPGGAVTTVATYATGYLITLTSQVQNLQPVTLTNQGGFYPKVINTALDRLTILVQQVVEQVGRAVKTPISSGLSPDQLIADLYAVEANAGNSATAAANSAANAAASAAAAAAVLDNFDDRYLGQKTVDPLVDNDGNPLQVGALYYNTVDGVMRVYTGTGWIDAATGVSSDDVSFLAAGTGAVGRNAQDKLRDFVSIKDFGAVGNGVTDDTTALTNFFNSANSRPGVEHRLEAKIYAVSALLPTINVSNVVIKGEGSEIHDVGTPLVTGTVLKWIGTPGTVGPLIKLSSVSGASNQRVSNVEFSGIGIDCNSGAINYGIELSSIRDSIVDVAVANAGFTGMNINVVASLGEAKDVQRNIIRLKARQVETRNAFCLTAGGDATANTSMNEFWVDCQHTDLQAIYLSNVDNNDWVFVRTYKAAGGTATESISLLGGATDAERCRAERFHFLTCNLPVHVYGTSGSPSFAFASINNKIYCLDTENGSPVPNVETDGSIRVQKDTTNLADDPWVSFTPTVSATSGTITSASATGYYIRRGKIVYVKIAITITTNGTGAGALGVTLPMATVGSMGSTFAGKERAITGKGIIGYADAGVSVMYMQFADGTYCGENGYVINMSGFYEVG